MALNGGWNVTSTGAFTYSIPFRLPPGTHHLAPRLALTYSSQGGDGYLGLGWSLSGLSAITRCAATITQDGAAGGVTYKGGPGGHGTSDRFCLDGKRLILITPNGYYGGAGTTYQPELTDYSSITANGQAGNGPASFDIYGRDGTHYVYGQTTDSQVKVGSSDGTIRIWALNEIIDTKGNYITFQYQTSSSEYYVTEIDYTGNSRTGTTPANHIHFTYTPRNTNNDVVPTFQAGYLVQITQLLTDITTTAGTAQVFDYHFEFNAAHSVTAKPSHDELHTITLCEGTSSCSSSCNPAGGTCLATTTLGWQGSGDDPTLTTPSISLGEAYDSVAPGDFNGDGLTDVLLEQSLNKSDCGPTTIFYGTTTGGHYTAATSSADYRELDGNNNDTIHKTGQICFPYSDSVPADINADGITDIEIHIDYHLQNGLLLGTIDSLINDGTTAFAQVGSTGQGTLPFISTRSYDGLPSDFNRDGFVDADAWDKNSENTFIYLFDSNTSNFDQTSQQLPSVGEANADFDGDGCTDVLSTNGGAITFSPYCGSAVSSGSAPAFAGYPHVYGDFNGDGKTDIILANQSGVCIYYSRGTGFPSQPDTCWEQSAGWWNTYTMVTGDFNGDGKTDIAFVCIQGQSCSSNMICMSNGWGFASPCMTSTKDIAAAATVADWNSDGAADIWMQTFSSSSDQYLFGYTPELMTSISNGLGAQTSVSYKSLNSDPSFYNKNQPLDPYPLQDVNGPIYVPNTVSFSAAGTATSLSWSYTYAGLVKDLLGRGSLGFSTVAVTDSRGNVQTMKYNTSFPYVGMLSSITLQAMGQNHQLVTVSNVANTPNYSQYNVTGGKYYFPYLQQSVSTGRDLDGSAVPTVTTTYAPDAFGNIQTKMVSIPHDGFTSTTTNSYVQNQSPWIVNELTESDTTNILGNASITRKNGFTPDGGTGLMTQAKLDTENPNVELDVAYGYDNFGNPNSVTESAPGNIPMASRTTTANWGTTGQFLNNVTNPLQYTSYFNFSGAFGSQTGLTDPNNISESRSPDAFGRPAAFTAPSGATTTTTYGYANNAGSCQPLPSSIAVGSCAFWSMTATTGPLVQGIGPQIAPTVCTYYDSLGRVIAADKQAFGGNWSRVTTSYDSLGRVSQVSQPYDPHGGSAMYTTYGYDVLDRVLQVAYPTDNLRNTGYINYQYSALQVVVTDDNGNSKTTIRNGEGLVTDVVDALNGDTHYDYDAFGDPVKVTTPGGKVIQNWFDSRGRKYASTDPDMGSWSYTYDALNELTGQTDNKQQSAVLKYDTLGRLTERDEADMVSTWTYDTAQYGIGRLARADCTAASGSTLPDACPAGTYDRSYIYDSFGRQISTRIVWTNGSLAQTYYTSETYDSNTTQLTMVRAFSGFTVKYNYNTQGYLCEIADYSTGGGGCTDSYSQFYWQANGDDSFGHIAQETAGNSIATTRIYSPTTGNLRSIAVGPSYSVENMSYSWDNVGNLTNRIDSLNGFSENFCYDPLNRLTNYSLSYSNGNQCGSGDIVKSMSYTSSDGTAIDGDIGQKSDTGNYSYTGANGAGPHAVTSIATSGVLVDGIHNPYFAYDGNGNMKCVTTTLPCNGSAARSYTWTSFNMIQQAKKGSTTATFTYTPEHQRFTQAISSGTVLYANDPVGGVMAERFSGTTATWRTYILAYGRIVAERFSQGANVTMEYFAGDHLTSTVALTNTNNQNAPYALAEQDSYDAWGKRRNINGSDNPNCSITSATLRGFTSQEMMDSFCLVNLNARLYDPTIGRILSADPTIPDGTNGQSFNRYSYVTNNPLSYNDPTGLSNCPQCEVVVVTGFRVVDGSGDYQSPGYDGGSYVGANATAVREMAPGDNGKASVIEVVVVTGNKLPPPAYYANFNFNFNYDLSQLLSVGGDVLAGGYGKPSSKNAGGCHSSGLSRGMVNWGRSIAASGSVVSFVGANVAMGGFVSGGPEGALPGLAGVAVGDAFSLTGNSLTIAGGLLEAWQGDDAGWQTAESAALDQAGSPLSPPGNNASDTLAERLMPSLCK